MSKDKPITIREARAELAMASSYTRMGILIDLAERGMRMTSWLRVLGEEWEMCDDIGAWQLDIYQIVEGWTPARQMMTTAERRVFDALPDVVTVYRGCGPHNQHGLSWSLSREIAVGFPFLHRYKQTEPMLVTARVQKDDILAYKNGRDEQEVIVFDHTVVSVERIEQRRSAVA
jgi:hypothetical protein